MKYSIKTYGGMVPKVTPRLLQIPNAQVALATNLRTGAAIPFSSPSVCVELDDPNIAYESLYLHEYNGVNLFLRFETDVDIVKGPIANDLYNRSYITGLDVPRVFDNTLLTSDSITIDTSNSYKLAIPSGTAATMSTDSLGTGDEVTRSYLYTYIRTWSDSKFDEGQPSDLAVASGNTYLDVRIGDTITISAIPDCPDQSNNNVTKIAVYRTSTGTTDTNYRLVKEFNIANAKAGYETGVIWDSGTSTFSITDSSNDEDLGETLKSITYAPPVDNLQGLTSLRNGCLVGFLDNVIYVSELYQPHAWPTAYQVTLDDTVIGIGAFGNTIVALTDRHPILINAQDPSSLLAEPTQSLAPCTSKRSIISFENTVYFASINGFFAINSSGIKKLTQDLFTSAQWSNFNPFSFESIVNNGRVFLAYENLDLNTSGFLVLDLQEAMAGAVKINILATALAVDQETDTFYFIQDLENVGWVIQKWEGSEDSFEPFIWKSKVFVSSEGPANFSAARVNAGFFSATKLAEIEAALAELSTISPFNGLGEINEVELNALQFNGDIYDSLYERFVFSPSIVFKFYVDGELILTKTIDSNKPFRLPAYISGLEFEVEIESNIPLYQIDIATSMRELM